MGCPVTAAFAAQPVVQDPCAAGPPLLAETPAGLLAATGTGLPELTPAWVAAHAAEVTLLDVSSAELPADLPLVVVCHCGSRSALASQHLLRWGDEGYPLERPIALQPWP